MAPSAKQQAQLKALVAQLPDPNNQGKLLTIDKGSVENIARQIHAGGREFVIGLIDMLVEPGKGNDIKPRYVLHVLAVHVCRLRNDKSRGEFARTVAAQLAGRPKTIQRYLIRQLQVAGGKEVAATLGTFLLDGFLCEYAAQALVSIGAAGEAARQFRAALGKARGACRRTAIQALAVLADPSDRDVLLEALTDPDRDVRISAGRGLANFARADLVAPLLKAADRHAGWEQIKQTKACLLLAEGLRAARDPAAARRVYTHLRDTRTKASEAYIRQAAAKALGALERE